MSTTEIWKVRGHRWSLPVVVERIGSKGVLKPEAYVSLPEIPMLRSQREVLTRELERIALWKTPDQWRVNVNRLSEVATLAPTDDLESLVCWGGGTVSTDKTKGDDAFLQTFIDDGMFDSMVEAKLVWNTVCVRMQDWLLNRQKPIDLGFVKLVALPFRMDWKRRLLTRHRGIRRRSDFVRQGVIDTMLGGTVTWLKEGLLFWTVEAVPMYSWWQAAKKVEQVRKDKRGDRYYAGVFDAMKRMLPYAIEALREFRTQERASVLAIREPRMARHFEKQHDQVFKEGGQNSAVSSRAKTKSRGRKDAMAPEA